MNELCGAKHPNENLDVLCGMPQGPNAVTEPVYEDMRTLNPDEEPVILDPAQEVHVHAGYDQEIPPGKYRWEDA